MIICDTAVGSKELVPIIRGMGVLCDKAPLQFADAVFEGKGPDGLICVGVERKTLHDMLNCIDDSRYSGHQRIGMKKAYQVSFLMLEGHWKPREDGMLMEAFNGGTSWTECKYRSQRTMYSKLYRYLVSIALTGVIITYSRDIYHTAHNICELFHYFQKKWNDHTSMREVRKLAIPQMNHKPKLVRLWADSIEGVGVKFGEEAERLFRKPITLANSDEEDWLKIPGLGVKKARDIVAEIQGYK